MVYGIAKMLNFAHGDIIMIGSYVVFVTVSSMGLPPMLGVLLAVAACTLLGVVIERVAYKPLRSASPLAVLITAIGVSYLLQNVALLIFGADTKSFTSVVKIPALKLADGQLNITGETIATILSCIVIMVCLMAFINRTRAGQAMLAVSEDKGANWKAEKLDTDKAYLPKQNISMNVAGVLSAKDVENVMLLGTRDKALKDTVATTWLRTVDYANEDGKWNYLEIENNKRGKMPWLDQVLTCAAETGFFSTVGGSVN